jgi:serine/threonine-protein kinase RIM15
MSPEAHSLIEGLLTMDPKKRLGSASIDEVKKHPFFKEIDWEHIMDIDAPFKPMGRDQDATYFPKANENDEDLQSILNDKQSILLR